MKMNIVENGLADEGKDVLEVIEYRATNMRDGVRKMSATTSATKILTDRPMYGPLLLGQPLVLRQRTKLGCCIFWGDVGTAGLYGAAGYRRGFRTVRRCAWWKETGCNG